MKRILYVLAASFLMAGSLMTSACTLVHEEHEDSGADKAVEVQHSEKTSQSTTKDTGTGTSSSSSTTEHHEMHESK